MKLRTSLVLVFLVALLSAYGILGASDTANTTEGHSETKGIKVVDWKWHHLQIYIAISLFLLIASVLKTIYHHIVFLVKYLPESNLLIVLGTLIGIIVFYTVPEASRAGSVWELTPDLFFLILLPPIMLEAAYSLYDRAFIENIGSIMYFAVIGTVLNFLIIGFSIFGLSTAGAMGEPATNITMSHGLLYGSFVVAVDPVAVLAIFHEIGVDHGLYYIVFGESLFNDAVTVVLYNMMNTFTTLPVVTPLDIVLGVVSFFTISLGGALVGVIVGAITCLITRFTYSTRVLEPLIILICAYLSYLAGDLLGWSGLIAIIFCGLVQAAYAFHNVSRKALVTLKYMTKMMASVAEGIIFIYLGIELVKDTHIWHWGFALWVLVLCLISRFLVTFVSCFVMNRLNRPKPIKLTEQFVIAYGGLRGAVAFALSSLLSAEALKAHGIEKEMYVTTTLFVIMFTCIIMGITIKPVVKCLHIRLESKPTVSIMNEIVEHITDHVNAGIEDILGRKGDNHFREWFDHVDDVYIRPFLQRHPQTHDERIVEMYQKVSLKMHYASTELDMDKCQEIKSQLAPGLVKRMSSQNSFTDLPSLPSYADMTATERKLKLGEKPVKISEKPDAGEVRKVMARARKNTSHTQANLSKTLHGESDIAHKMHEVQSRVARGLHLLKRGPSFFHHWRHHENHHHGSSGDLQRNNHSSSHDIQEDAINDLQHDGSFVRRGSESNDNSNLALTKKGSTVRFQVDNYDSSSENASATFELGETVESMNDLVEAYANPTFVHIEDENTDL